MRSVVAVALLVAGLSHAQAQTEAAPFHGLYIAGGGSFGHSENLLISGSGALGSIGTGEALTGASGVAALGYNLQFGHGVVGLELSGRFGRERLSEQSSITTVTIDNIGSEALSLSQESRFGGHLSLRGGAAINNVMIFGQIGLGFSEHTSRLTIAGSGSQCLSLAFIGGRIVCGVQQPIASTDRSHARWLPSALIGLGIEANFGRAFVRAAAQAEGAWMTGSHNVGQSPNSIFIAGDDVLWTGRAIGAIGFRF